MVRVELTGDDAVMYTEQWLHEDTYIEVTETIFRGKRVCIRPVNSYYYLANWCAGAEEFHKDRLIAAAKYVIENELEYPFCSKIKPYFNDPEFLEWVESIEQLYDTGD